MRAARVVVPIASFLLPFAAIAAWWRFRPESAPPLVAIEPIPPLSAPPATPTRDGVVAGRVEDADGSPYAGAEVRATAEGFLEVAASDETGSFRFEATPEGPLEIVALAPRRRPALRAGVRAGTTDLVLRLGAVPPELPEPLGDLPPPPGFLVGRLRREDGGSLEGFAVGAVSLEEEGMEGGFVRFAEATFDGFFEVAWLPPGRYRVLALLSKRKLDLRYRYAQADVEIRSTEDTMAELAFACSAVEGVVQGPEGLPFAGAVAHLLYRLPGDERCEAGIATTAEDGAFRFGNLPLGAADLEVHASGFATLSREVALEPGRAARVEVALENRSPR